MLTILTKWCIMLKVVISHYGENNSPSVPVTLTPTSLMAQGEHDMKKLIEIALNSGEKIFIETEDNSPRQSVSAGSNIVRESEQYLERSLAQIRAFAGKISESVKAIPIRPDEFEVEFNGKFTAEAGIVFTSLSSEAGVTITLRWTKDE